MDYPYDLGRYSRTVTTTSADAQRWFDRGLNWCFGYHHEEAIACFEKALETVNQVMGDGIMALFGAPLAHEDHAVRVCYGLTVSERLCSEGSLVKENATR